MQYVIKDLYEIVNLFRQRANLAAVTAEKAGLKQDRLDYTLISTIWTEAANILKECKFDEVKAEDDF